MDRVLHVDDQPLGAGLLPVVDLVERAHLAGRDAAPRRAPASQCSAGAPAGAPPRSAAMSSSRWATRSPLVAKRGSSVREPELAGERPPLCLGAAGHLDRRGPGAEEAVRRDRRVLVARPARAPRPRPSTGCPGRRARRPCRRAARCGRRGRGRCAPARRAPPPRRTRRSSRRRRSAIGTPTFVGSSIPVRLIRPPSPWRDLVVAGAVRLGAVVAEAGDGEDDQPRVELVQPGSTGKPRRSSTPGRKFSISTSARRDELGEHGEVVVAS